MSTKEENKAFLPGKRGVCLYRTEYNFRTVHNIKHSKNKRLRRDRPKITLLPNPLLICVHQYIIRREAKRRARKLPNEDCSLNEQKTEIINNQPLLFLLINI